ncbi:glycosyltransferase family 1 protein [uncultured Adlercreutzia sp.]|uniref:glycosyltransferase family 1 protein n=1 Tax=uncultured Adlercreutzia sp. TaxID=875803 RepID=UPI0025EFF08A|nr:glycosyltransferase family 1 protein [uncultured Adlercreutzia sp.]
MRADGPLKVLQVVTTLDRGGLETVLLNYFRNIDKNEIQFDFLKHRDHRGAFEDEIESLGGNVFSAPRANPFDPRYYSSLRHFFNRHGDYAIVHSHINCMSFLPLLAAQGSGVPIRIAHSHNTSQERDFRYPIKMACKKGIPLVATDLAACGRDAGLWLFGGRPFDVIPNAIDVESFRFDPGIAKETRARLGVSPETMLVGHVGRFNQQKNHLFLLEIFRHVVELYADAVLVLVGGGALEDGIRGRVASLGLSQNVIFTGPRSDVSRYYQAFDVFALPSLFEGLPTVLVEAQASGLPCLVSDTITDECDFGSVLVKRLSLEDSPRAWADELIRLGRKGRDRAKGVDLVRGGGYDIREQAVDLAEYYRGLVSLRAR